MVVAETVDRRTPRVALPGREAVVCGACQKPLIVSQSESHAERHRYVFRCTTATCDQRGVRVWWELRPGRPPARIDSRLIRQQGAGRNQPRLKIPESIRSCATCHRWRAGSRYKLVGRPGLYRLYCRRCRRAELYTGVGKLTSAGSRGGRWKYPMDRRPRCERCGRFRVVSHQRTFPGIGRVLRYICSPSRRAADCSSPPEYWTAQGHRRLSSDEVGAFRSETNFKTRVPIKGFDRAERARCSECRRPMSYEGVVRQGAACRFVCRRGHGLVARYFDRASGAELPASARLRKAFPWGDRPPCPECGGQLVSGGEWTEAATGRHVYRLLCRSSGCAAFSVHLDERGAVVRQPGSLLRRGRPRLSSTTTKGAKRWCAACLRRLVAHPDDERSRYCVECSQDKTPYKLWKASKTRVLGSERLRLHLRLRSPTSVRRLRDERGWTQRTLAKESGLSLPLVKKIEQGAVRLTRRSRERLGAAFAGNR